MFCYSCGQAVSDEMDFCPKCGVHQKLDLRAATPEEKTENKSLGVIFNEMSPPQRVWSIVGIVVAVLFIISYVAGGNSTLNVFSNYALSRPAVEYVVPGEASQTLQQVWGVELNGAGGPVSLLDMADQAFYYISSSVGGGVTKSDVEIAFQPGNSMHSFFNRLLNSQNAINAVKERWLALAE